MKNPAIYEEAKKLFVQQGLNVQAIANIINGDSEPKAVTDRTILNWKIDNNWDQLRNEFITANETIEADLFEILKIHIAQTKANVTPQNIYSLMNMMQVLRIGTNIEGIKNGSTNNAPKAISEKTINEVREIFLGV